jgi:HAD superfamily hydrolase (TIGR01458 family)
LKNGKRGSNLAPVTTLADVSRRGLLLDLDGTLYEGDRAIAGAPEALARLRAAGFRLRLTTNTTRVSRRALHAHLTALGFDVDANELFTAPLAAAAWVRGQGLRRVALCVPAAAHEDFAEFVIDEERPEAVVVGDLGADWTYERLTRAFRWLLDDARLVAIQMNRYWRTPDGLALDAGPFVAALEYAADTAAVVVGKPAPEFFAAAIATLGLAASETVVTGDDIWTDVTGGQRAGCRTVLVRTGKYRAGDERRLERQPDLVIGSVAELPEALGPRAA